MTTSRDPEALLTAYLADGMSVLPDRVVDAVLDEVHRTRQRSVLGPWRTQPMFKLGLAAAAVVAVVIGGSALLGAFDAPPGPGAPSGSLEATQAATTPPTPSPSPTPGLPEFPGPGPRVTLTNGTTYWARPFSQSMTFTMPDVTAELGPNAVAEGFTYGDGGHTMQITYVDSIVTMTIHDDFKIDTNLCRPNGQTQEVPATPEAVGDWLHDQRNTEGLGLTVTDQPDMTVDGRAAKVYDIELGFDCGGDYLGDVSSWSGQKHRMYAIPTGTDTMLVITWNTGVDQGGTVPQESVTAIGDRLVASFDFD